MTADILLTHGYYLLEDAHERKYMKPYPPLGLLYLTAYLRESGFEAPVMDATFATREQVYQRLAAREAPVLGVYTNLITRSNVLDIVQRARAAGWQVVLGGPESANYPAEYLNAGANVVVFGEGEETLAELLPAMASGRPEQLHGVAGIAYLDDNGQVVHGPPRPNLRELDRLPWPDRSAIDLAPYRATWRQHHGAAALNLITARGCPYRCRWCSHAVFGYHHARRSPADVVAEVAHLRDCYQPDLLWFSDDVFTMSHRWLGQYLALARQRDLLLPFECITRADRVTPEVARQLAELGCFRVWLGSESGSQRVLDAMERGVTVAQVRESTRQLQAAGIAVGMFLMWGYEGEEADDIEATIEHVKRTNPDVFLTTVAYPIRGTPYFEEVADRVRPTRPWSMGSDRDAVVHGRHSRRFYSFATRRLRSEVALHRLRGESRPPLMPLLRAVAGTGAARMGMRLTEHEREA